MGGEHVQAITPIWYPISHRYTQLHETQTNGQSSQAPTVLAGENKNLL